MSRQKTVITADELLTRVMDGERDFALTRLSREDNGLSNIDGYDDLLLYLQTHDLRAEPIDAHGADWSNLKAQGLFLPFARMTDSDLSGADFTNADFHGSDFSNSNLRLAVLNGANLVASNLAGADLTKANLTGADLCEAHMLGTVLCDSDLMESWFLRVSLQNTDVTGASMDGAFFYRTDFRGLKGLDRVIGLSSAIFYRPIVTSREQQIIQSVSKNRLVVDLQAK